MNKITAARIKKTLTVALNLLDDPEKWTKNAGARTKHGSPIRCFSRNAACFCLSGAIIRAAWQNGYITRQQRNNTPYATTQFENFLADIDSYLYDFHPGYGDIIHLNDDPNTTYEDIINMLKSAIKGLENG